MKILINNVVVVKLCSIAVLIICVQADPDDTFCRDEFKANIRKKVVTNHGIHFSRRLNAKSIRTAIVDELHATGIYMGKKLDYIVETLKFEMPTIERAIRDEIKKHVIAGKQKITALWPNGETVEDCFAQLEPYFSEKKDLIFQTDRLFKNICYNSLIQLSELIGEDLHEITKLYSARNGSVKFFVENFVPTDWSAIDSGVEKKLKSFTLEYFVKEEANWQTEKENHWVDAMGLPRSYYDTEENCWQQPKALLLKQVQDLKSNLDTKMIPFIEEIDKEFNGQRWVTVLRAFEKIVYGAETKLNEIPRFCVAPSIFKSLSPKDRLEQVSLALPTIQAAYLKFGMEINDIGTLAFKQLQGLVFRMTLMKMYVTKRDSATSLLSKKIHNFCTLVLNKIQL